MSELKIKLMYREAVKRYEDGEFLRAKRDGDSGYLLKLLSFELFLKCVLFIEKGQDNTTHNYHGMFCSLSKGLKSRLLGRAQEVSQVFTIQERIETLLNTYASNFIRLRYPYQSYKSLTEEELREYGHLYAELGFPEGEAEFEYYPAELRGLILAMIEFVGEKIANRVKESI